MTTIFGFFSGYRIKKKDKDECKEKRHHNIHILGMLINVRDIDLNSSEISVLTAHLNI